MPIPPDPPVIRAIILGSDTLLAAQPTTPLQLARACLSAGWDFVAPVSWGEELLAEFVADRLRGISAERAVAVTCPFVAEALRATPPLGTPCITGVAPPVATARYLRAALGSHVLRISYAGRCPGASDPELDEVLLPEVLQGRLLEAGIDPKEQPLHFDGQLPPERARFASLPGGLPEPSWLADATGALEREATPLTIRAVTPVGSERTLLIDAQVACGCICARDRFAVAQLEPPRSTARVTAAAVQVDLAPGHAGNGWWQPDTEGLGAPDSRRGDQQPLKAPAADGGSTATLMARAARVPTAANSAAADPFTVALEPWAVRPRRRRRPPRRAAAME